MPLVTVVIPTKNRLAFLREALESLNRQTFKDFEVVVVNDGGAPLGDKLLTAEASFDLRLIESQSSRGPSLARNDALAVSRGDYVAFLDDDDIFLPEHLADAVTMLNTGSCDLAYSGALLTPRRTSTLPATMADSIYINGRFDASFLLVMCNIPMSSVVCRNPRHVDARFNDDLIVCEDWELWIRLQEVHGFRFQHTDRISVIYHRIPDADNVSFATTIATEGLKRFVDAWGAIVAQYTTGNALVSTYRDYVRVLHRVSLEILRSGGRLSHYCYEDFTDFLLQNFLAGRSIDNVDGKVRQIAARRVFNAD